MIIAGGSYYPNGEYKTRRSRALFSRDGKAWSRPAPVVVEDGHWLWRVTWHKGVAYGVSKYGDPRKVRLVSGTGGVQWKTITELAVPGGDETTVRFLPDDRMTGMISMYSSVYRNTGSANQPIFESSQRRFTSGYSDNLDAYVRNSPVLHAQKVQTPLMILHNDKDGAIDFTQGVEYFSTLRRLQKPVIMLQYKGENHGLRVPANQKDYLVRMREYFAHHLKGESAPAWLTGGVPLLKLSDHLDGRENLTARKQPDTATGAVN
ncbi:MAG: prolyl oligopeptidase family serine peptidase [Acidobacteria bacterium]|nr:prolyl oligopeptidase family serine peptidase [Acidobacteriota bacterium]